MLLLAINLYLIEGDFYMFGPKCFARPQPIVAPMPMMHAHPIGCGMTPVAPGPVIPVGGECAVTQEPCEVVVEPALVAAPNIYHHHKNVQHIQPVITQDIHHYHSHHKYMVEEQKQCAEVVKHAHGLCGPAATRPAQPCPPTSCGR